MNSAAGGRTASPVEPRVCSFPAGVSTAGGEAVELAALAGLMLDPWQAFVLEHSLAERGDGKWAAFEVGVVVSRQNGKGAILEARELAGLFLLGERLIIHSAHEFATSMEHFRRLLGLIEDCPDLERRIRAVKRSHGEESIELKGGQRIQFRTRTKGGGRGFSSDCLILDEAMDLPEAKHGALLPTLSARPNPQVWYTASAVDQMVHENGIVLSRIRERGLAGDDLSLAYFEWSLDAASPEHVTPEKACDVAAWALSNPGLGIRISPDHVRNEHRSMDARTFAVERLNCGDWPRTDGLAATVISLDVWNALEDIGSRAIGAVGFAFDVNPDRSWSTIAAVGVREDGIYHLEIVDRRRGTGWLVERIADLIGKHENLGVICDAAGPAASLLPELHQAGVPVTTVTGKEHATGCGLFFDAAANRRLRHLGTPELTSAVKGAASRPLGDAWAWSRKTSAVDISPLVACTLAFWGVATGELRSELDVMVAFA